MPGILEYVYRFRFKDGKEVKFRLSVDSATLNLIPEPQPQFPAWTELSTHKCPNCLLDDRLDPHCPVALSLLGPVNTFKEDMSYEEAEVHVVTPDREFVRQTTLQQGLSSMIGLCMATSGCPVMEKLKPMVRFHLPFATGTETTYRVLSMYMLAQYIIHKRGGQPDLDLKYLQGMYDGVREVNKHVVQRLGEADISDAALKALLNLDCFAISIKFTSDFDSLEDITNLFTAYL